MAFYFTHYSQPGVARKPNSAEKCYWLTNKENTAPVLTDACGTTSSKDP